ncbi:phage baseplate assembly protein V [Burkholderia plantarii]|uniref:phage baseplate assembly protein V n=1 Tax=Burkholderia plantarii TaxID=41899 RepID=UPI00272B0211|nr:phage baseplate assembly protein V [Burkholderia plantarii]WLE60875.1 phage baseplate assembly protein V [Burkholderia plantarii]
MNANEIQRQARNAVRKGSIEQIDAVAALCRVAIGTDEADDDGGIVTNWIPWFALAAGDTIEWRAPTIGEQVMLLCPMGDPAQGVALCGFYSDAFPAPANAATIHMRKYPDGALTVYDHAQHALSVTLPDGAVVRITVPGGNVSVTTQTADITADTVLLDADVTVKRSLTVEGPLTFESGMKGKSTGDGAVMEIEGDADFTGDVKSKGISLPGHTHREQGDGNLVSAPQNPGGES